MAADKSGRCGRNRTLDTRAQPCSGGAGFDASSVTTLNQQACVARLPAAIWQLPVSCGTELLIAGMYFDEDRETAPLAAFDLASGRIVHAATTE